MVSLFAKKERYINGRVMAVVVVVIKILSLSFFPPQVS
jgi:hypothetical protein